MLRKNRSCQSSMKKETNKEHSLTPTVSGRDPMDTDEAIMDGTQSVADHAPLLSSPVSCPSRTTQVSRPLALADSKS